METFTELALNPAISQALGEMGFDKPTPIQAQAIPVLLNSDTDYLGLAATGTGKTAAFGIPLLQKIDLQAESLQALVLCPTRELAQQTSGQLSRIGKYLNLQVPAIYGGARYREQIEALSCARVVVATPGRLLDHLGEGRLSLAGVRLLVLDEADKMISMGFQEALDEILKAIPRETCRTWLFSATMPEYLKRVARRYLKTPAAATVKRQQVLPGTVRQLYYTVREKNKAKGLCKLIDMSDSFYGLIFCQTKALVMELTQFLRARHYPVDCLHGDKDQRDRERTLSLFRTRQVAILVCTDVAARGLDVDDLTHVINYSLPFDLESYIHRIGRTGRNGKEGLALSLVAPTQMGLISRLEKMTQTKWEAGIFPTRKQVSVKKLTRFLPRFEAAPGHERALEILDETWTARLESLSKQEIAGRFLALALPDLFDPSLDAIEDTSSFLGHLPMRGESRQAGLKDISKGERMRRPLTPYRRTNRDSSHRPPETRASTDRRRPARAKKNGYFHAQVSDQAGGGERRPEVALRARGQRALPAAATPYEGGQDTQESGRHLYRRARRRMEAGDVVFRKVRGNRHRGGFRH